MKQMPISIEGNRLALTSEEMAMLLEVLDKVPIQGRMNQLRALEIARKLQEAMADGL